MNRKIAVMAILAFLTVPSGLTSRVQTIGTDGTIYIRADGSIDPPTALIQRIDDLYILNGSITTTADGIAIERNNMTLDGAGYLIQGTGTGTGIDLTERSNVTVKNMKVDSFYHGIELFNSENNTVAGNVISIINWNGIGLSYSSNNTIVRNNMTQCQYYGIGLDNSPSNTISENNMINNDGGLYFDWSSHNTVIGNNVTANSGNGIRLQDAEYNLLRNNVIAHNTYNFEVFGELLPQVTHEIDRSNTVNGKPIYYLINQSDSTVPVDAGFIALVNCTRMLVQNLSLTDNGKGILVAATTNSTITDNNIADNACGLWIFNSTSNTIHRNHITTNSFYGIYSVYSSNNSISANQIEKSSITGVSLYFSDNNTLCGNQMTGNLRGMQASGSHNSIFGNYITANDEDGLLLSGFFSNCIAGNNIAGNGCGIELYDSANSSIYNNNFMNNAVHVNNHAPSNVDFWDDGYPSGGNYWQGYHGTDLYSGIYQSEPDSDGIADAPRTIDANNTDNYPLMGPFSNFNTSLGYDVNVVSNTTIESFEYFEFSGTFRIRVSNSTANQTTGFCRVSIPHALMNVSSISVIIDDGLTPVLYENYALYDNGTHRWIYFTYPHSAHKIDIIPEFSTVIMTLILLIATPFAVIVRRKKLDFIRSRHNLR
jgi:parallel beta-helix repeat protein